MKRIILIALTVLSLTAKAQFDPFNVPEKEIEKYPVKLKHTAEWYKSAAKDAYMFSGFSALLGAGAVYGNTIGLFKGSDINPKVIVYSGYTCIGVSLISLMYASMQRSNYNEALKYKPKNVSLVINSNGFGIAIAIN